MVGGPLARVGLSASDHHPGAGQRESLGERETDTAGAAGDDGGPAGRSKSGSNFARSIASVNHAAQMQPLTLIRRPTFTQASMLPTGGGGT